MIKKNSLILLLAAMLLVAGTITLLYKNKHTQQAANDLLPVDLHTIKLADGWGYEVLVDKKVFIHQDCIPAIASYKRFTTESEALLIGNKVVDKIKHGQKPSISEQDIIDSHIRH